MVKAVRGATQAACRVLDMGNEELARTARAFCGSDEARDPFDKRKSATSAARRLVRGSDASHDSLDFWTCARASKGGPPGEESLEPQAEPGGQVSPPSRVMETFACRPTAVRKERPLRGGDLAQSSRPVSSRGEHLGPIPEFPVNVMGLSPAELDAARQRVERLEWRDRPFHLGRGPFGPSASPTLHALFGPFVPLERLLGAAHRPSIRIRGDKLGVLPSDSFSPLSVEECLNAAIRAIPKGLDAQDAGPALRECSAPRCFGVQFQEWYSRWLLARRGEPGPSGWSRSAGSVWRDCRPD